MPDNGEDTTGILEVSWLLTSSSDRKKPAGLLEISWLLTSSSNRKKPAVLESRIRSSLYSRLQGFAYIWIPQRFKKN
ncbi:uncharacterized protein LOC108220905 isoform X3 [Daucus carota subsp. sativus]|uniref:uncharacterized protein LOC108220905 isoform X3 n=1 Tax=Daucus carota subsp. sativus TaxID=79200 RepID=UPI0030839B63